MEDGDNADTTVFTKLNPKDAPVHLLPDMANYPDIEVTVIKNKSATDTNIKVNGESSSKDDLQNDDGEEEDNSTDEDALVIDEDYKSSRNSTSVSRKRFLSPTAKTVFKGFKKRMLRQSTEVLKIVNDCISAAETGKVNRITSYGICDKSDESISQGESCNIEPQEALTKNVNYTEIPIKEDNETPSLVQFASPLIDEPTQNTTPSETIPSQDFESSKLAPSRPLITNKLSKKTPGPKLTEYAQYLGLQPTVKFKCYKCSDSSFPSMGALNDHQLNCKAQPQKVTPSVHQTPSSTSTNFRVTRKVYLCSACGTYYENWNLFLHMREVHRRFVCLYCLGMFSFVEKLTQHLITKHCCSPTSYVSLEDYLTNYKDSSVLLCCHCENVFTEQDNFLEHVCTERTTISDKICWSCGIKGSSPHLASCKASIEQPPTKILKRSNEQDSLSEYINTDISNINTHLSTCRASIEPSTSNQKAPKQRVPKQKPLKRNFSSIQHVTADSPSTLIPSPVQTCDIANLCTVDMEPTISSEPDSPAKQNPSETRQGATETHQTTEIQQNSTETQQDTTETQQDTTETQQDVTETQQDATETLQDPSETQPDTTETQQNTETRKESSETRQDTTETHQDMTETKQDTSETKQDTSETKQDTSETQQDITEIQQDTTKTPQDAPEPSETQENSNNSDDLDNRDFRNAETQDNYSQEDCDKNLDSQSERKEKDMEESYQDLELPKSNESSDNSDLNAATETANEMLTQPEENSDSDEHLSVSEADMDVEPEYPEPMETEPVEVRRVPKVTLKLPPPGTTFSDNESEDSDKMAMEVDQNDESDQEFEESQNSKDISTEKPVNGIEESYEENEDPQNDQQIDNLEPDGFQVAGEEVPIIELELDQPLDKLPTENLLKTCLNATISTCIYCNHARKIAVDGKQLGLHAIAEHRFSATVNSITAEELIPNNFVVRIKSSLDEIENHYFNLELKTTEEPFKREYECFQCRYVTLIHKELYLHNRKMHAKTILLCIMCKSNFYSYSELICHLCPGDYVLNTEMKFRCCMCDIPDLPSAFRLMVHLRKRHHTCDVCLEGCQNQSRLSNHVWKHKLHHLCYRCGIAYRNKPDITKHLFWKHGTESVLCKKCLQKKWPHVYHFCIPPTAFVCEECNLSFSKAVYLKVHKRLHSNEKKHACLEENCKESFISRRLLLKHEKRHREPDPVPEIPAELVNGESELENSNKPEYLDKEILKENTDPEVNGEEKEDVKKNIIDVYDLPALNLSESDSSDTEEEKSKELTKPQESQKSEISMVEPPNIEPLQMITEPPEEQKPEQLDGVWDNFKQYQATIEKRDGLNIDNKDPSLSPNEEMDEKKDKGEELLKEEPEKVKSPVPEIKEPLCDVQEEIPPDLEVILNDHDYCIPSPEQKKDESMDHDYCTVSETAKSPKPEEMTKKKDKKKNSSSSDSSSDSDSSSCTCGSNCSCSSSSGSSSSSSSSSDSDSSSSEGRRRIAARRERRKERAKRKKESETSQAASNTSQVDVIATEEAITAPPVELPIEESDLDTDETETDEDFYDEHPQKIANKILEEKRNQLLLLAGVTTQVSNGSIVECSRPSTPSIPEETPVKKKVKSKKRKKKSRSLTPKYEITQNIPFQNHQPSPLSITPAMSVPVIPESSPISAPQRIPPPEHSKFPQTGSGSETDSTIRSSKRRRVPNKFYGYSSDEEASEKPPAPPILKWRKADLPSTPTTIAPTPKFVPPITIKNIPSPAPIVEPSHAPAVHHADVKDSDSETETQLQKSSSDSSDSNQNEDSDSDGQLHISQPPSFPLPALQPPMARTNENLYCYCQCPYDEVSEMIACDGRDCAIEWFHFECVGIMVPPKGKWFCPDCRKKAAMRNDYLQM